MKTLLLTILLQLLIATSASSETAFGIICTMSVPGGNSIYYGADVSASQVQSLPEWVPGEAGTPLSINEAFQIAKAYAKETFNFNNPVLSYVTINRCDGKNSNTNKWYYLVNVKNAVPDDQDPSNFPNAGYSMQIPVLTDGTVPTVRESRKISYTERDVAPPPAPSAIGQGRQ